MQTVFRQVLNRLRLPLLRATRNLAAWVEPRDPTHLSSQLERGEIVWQAFVDAGIALRRCDRFEEADRMLERGLGAFPNDRTLLQEYAMSAHNSGRYDIAIERWERAVRVAPDVAMCHCGLAANLRETNRLDRAQAVIDAALAIFPEDLVVLSEAARVAAAQHEDETALNLWRKVAASPTPSPEWIQGEAQALLNLGRHAEAETVLRAGLDRFPEAQGLMAVEGLLATALRDVSRAVTIWSAYRSRFPDDKIGQDQFDRAIRAADPTVPALGTPAGLAGCSRR